MDATKELAASQIAAITDRLMSKPVATRYGRGFNGRFLSKYVSKVSGSTRDKSQPIIRGHLSRLQPVWRTLDWLPNLELITAVIEVHCPYCDLPHRHGWSYTFLTGQFMERRVAHCGIHHGNWARDDGYWIAPFRQQDAGYQLHAFNPGTVFARKVVG